jgi:hypothetical protein
MRKFNTVVLDITVAILDFLYRGRDYQRFWVLDEVEIHAATTYGKYLAMNGPDEKILEILNDELNHSQELVDAMEMIDV